MTWKSFRAPFVLPLLVTALAAAPTLAQDVDEAAELFDAAAEEIADTAEEAVEAVEEAAAEAPPVRAFEDYVPDAAAPAATAVTTSVVTTSAPAATSADTNDNYRTQIVNSELAAPSRFSPSLEWHGYFRFRADSFWNLDLDTEGTSPILPPIEALLAPENDYADPADQIQAGGDGVTDPDAENLSSANIRLRLRPIIHIAEDLRIHLEMNILDNLVMGSTPDGFNERAPANLRTDMPVIGFSGSQEPPNFYNNLRNSVSVTQAYGEVKTFVGVLRLGRMASHWGLGILANGGGNYSGLGEPERFSSRSTALAGHGCLDCDYGDYVDRAMFVTKAFGIYLMLGYDFNYAGPTNVAADDYFGQPRDLSEFDDVNSFTIAIFQRPMSPEEVAMREHRLVEQRRTGFDWGAYVSIRRQKISAEGFTAGSTPGSLTFVNREALAIIPDLWLRVQHKPTPISNIRLEAELAGIFGSLGNADPRGQNNDKERDIRQFAAAIEFDYRNGAMSTGLNAGFATGRSFDEEQEGYVGFGVQDAWTLSDTEPVITNFKFDRDYFVDAIMFREIIGTITNAVYFNPFFQYNLVDKGATRLGLRLDLITAFAANAEATPSGESYYGLETDLTLYYQEQNFRTDIMAGAYIPGAAFDAIAGNPRMPTVARSYGSAANIPFAEDKAASAAWTVQGRFFWAF